MKPVHDPDCDVNDVNPEGIRKPCNCGVGEELKKAFTEGWRAALETPYGLKAVWMESRTRQVAENLPETKPPWELDQFP